MNGYKWADDWTVVVEPKITDPEGYVYYTHIHTRIALYSLYSAPTASTSLTNGVGLLLLLVMITV